MTSNFLVIPPAVGAMNEKRCNAMRRRLYTLAVAMAAAVVTLPVMGQYPVKAIRIIVPFGAGGPSDLLARTTGQKLTEAWGPWARARTRRKAEG